MAKNEFFEFLIAQAEKVELAIWEVVDAFDNGKDIDNNKCIELRERASRIMANAENKTQFKKLSRILDPALHSLKSCA